MNASAKLLSVKELADWLGVSEAWVYDHASGRKKPALPAVKIGASVRFRRESIETWITDCEQNKVA